MSRPKKRGGRFTPPKLTRRGKVRRLVDSARAKAAASPTGTIPVKPR